MYRIFSKRHADGSYRVDGWKPVDDADCRTPESAAARARKANAARNLRPLRIVKCHPDGTPVEGSRVYVDMGPIEGVEVIGTISDGKLPLVA